MIKLCIGEYYGKHTFSNSSSRNARADLTLAGKIFALCVGVNNLKLIKLTIADTVCSMATKRTHEGVGAKSANTLSHSSASSQPIIHHYQSQR